MITDETRKQIEEEISNLTDTYNDMLERLPYADGQAYYNDRARINSIRNEISLLRSKLEK